MSDLQALAAAVVERVTGTKIDAKSEADFRDALASGHVLCHMLNALHPPLALKPRSGNLPFMQMENVSLYLQGCRDIGLSEFELFMTPDLYEGKSIHAVVTNILAVARTFQVDISPTPSVTDVQASFASAKLQNTCRRCGKTVYAMEQMLALNSVWHKACFRCAGCNRTLPAGSYLDHDSDPYCKSCYDKQFRPKGYHAGASVDSFQETAPPTQLASDAPPQSQVHCRAPSSPAPPTSNTPSRNTPTPAPTPLSAPASHPSPQSKDVFGAASLNRRIQGNVFDRYSTFADQSAASPVAPLGRYSPGSPFQPPEPKPAAQASPPPARPPAQSPAAFVPAAAPVDESNSAAPSTLVCDNDTPAQASAQAMCLAPSTEPPATPPRLSQRSPRGRVDVQAPSPVVALTPAPTTWSATHPSPQLQSATSPVVASEDGHQYSYLRKPRGLKSTTAAVSTPSKGTMDMFNSTSDKTVPYEDMKRDLSMNVLTADEAIAKWAQLGINGDKREQHLADAEFQQVLNMSKADWAKLAEWKRVHLRKQHHLY
eukprot:CAMPEP_0114231548 /NCGR_PEP_ID=MMETSP0058-20121206/4110_1 /TAXON_ID=36894 /ORGANISM="Pyramimonas parkeae, CCMP726" /LENGTH=540 /DNA_ID=CAMNT_0001342919 /DNA_START=38 /DNA_END=1660 /DNA_ORIENTATION=+